MIDIPNTCPSCQSDLERVKDQLFCRNTNCKTQQAKVVEKYANKVKIKGLGPVAVKKLGLVSVADIYDLTEEILEEVLGKNGIKVYQEIQKKKSISLDLFLGSNSIPLVGQTTAKKITTDIDSITMESLAKDGLGTKASENLVAWLASNSIPPQIEFQKAIVEKPLEALITICISGKTPGYTKASLSDYLKDYKVKVVTGVTKDIDYLISQEQTSAKAQKAIKLNKTILTFEEFKKEIKI